MNKQDLYAYIISDILSFKISNQIEQSLLEMLFILEKPHVEEDFSPSSFWFERYGTQFLNDDLFDIHAQVYGLVFSKLDRLFRNLLENQSWNHDDIISISISYEMFKKIFDLNYDYKKGEKSNWNQNSETYRKFLESRKEQIELLEKEFKFLMNLCEKKTNW